MDNSLEELDKIFVDMVKQFPEARSILCDEVGDLMYNQVVENINSSIDDTSGKLTGAVTKKKGSKGGYIAIQPNFKIAPHTRPIEQGYKIVRGGKVCGWVNGKHMYRNAINQVADEIEAKAEEMLNKIGDSFK